MWCDPVAHPAAKNAGNVDLDHAVAAPFVGHRALNAYIVAFLCNAMQFRVQCRMADPGGMRLCGKVATLRGPPTGLAGNLAHYSASDRILRLRVIGVQREAARAVRNSRSPLRASSKPKTAGARGLRLSRLWNDARPADRGP